MARSDGGMTQGGKHLMGARARARRSTHGRVAAAKPAVGGRGGRAAHGLRPAGQPPPEPADPGGAADSRSYRQWAAFATGTQDADCGLGAYFIGELPSRYTWTPGRD
jgi:hypothetical protein